LNRRILLDLEVNDKVPGALFEIANKISEALEDMQSDNLVIDFGFSLLLDEIPVVRRDDAKQP